MAIWLAANYGTVLIGCLLAALIIGIVLTLRHDKKKNGSCGCGCEHCAMKDQCRKPNE